MERRTSSPSRDFPDHVAQREDDTVDKFCFFVECQSGAGQSNWWYGYGCLQQRSDRRLHCRIIHCDDDTCAR
jgi:hypothetical protein